MALQIQIECIAVFGRDGNPKPVKLRIEDTDGRMNVGKVLTAIHTGDNRFSGNRMMVFDCQVQFGSQLRVCDVRYELDSCRWFLYNIQ